MKLINDQEMASIIGGASAVEYSQFVQIIANLTEKAPEAAVIGFTKGLTALFEHLPG